MFWKIKRPTNGARGGIVTADDEVIAMLNDAFRATLGMSPLHNGTVLLSAGVVALGAKTVADILLKIARYDFLADRNESERRRLGIIDGPHGRIAWRIFCYEDEGQVLETAGDRVSDYRVMEIGLASEIFG